MYNKRTINKMKRQSIIVIRVIIIIDFDPLNIIGNHEYVLIL